MRKRHLHPPLGTEAPQRRRGQSLGSVLKAEGQREGARGGGRAGAQLWASRGADGEMASGGPRPTPPHPTWPRGGCAVGAALVQSVCVCSCEHACGVLPPSPLTPCGWEQRLHSGVGVGVSPLRPLGAAGHRDSHADCRALHAPDGPGFLQAFSAALLLPFAQLWEERGARGWGLWVTFCPILCSPLLWGCLSPR